MSNLKVYWPEEDPVEEHEGSTTQDAAETATDVGSDEPAIYSFVSWLEQLRSPVPDAAMLRAKRLHANHSCPSCKCAGVLPLMLNDGRIDNAGRLIPGTATLVGFRCEHCSHEWSA